MDNNLSTVILTDHYWDETVPSDLNGFYRMQNYAHATLRTLFAKAAEKGVGIELNFPYFDYAKQDLESILHIYRVAKDCGCKFYFGSDAHHLGKLQSAKALFEAVNDALELTEADKFKI